jgi:hypothetical protein
MGRQRVCPQGGRGVAQRNLLRTGAETRIWRDAGIRFIGLETCNEVGAVIAEVGGDVRKRVYRIAAVSAGLGWVSIFAPLARRRGRSTPTDRRQRGCESWC